MAADTVAGFLRERRLPVDESDVVDVLRRLLGPHLVATDSAALTTRATKFLRDHSGVEPSEAAVETATKEAIAATAAMVQTSLSMAQVADLLGVDQSRVRHRIADGALYPVRVGRANRLPAWQFVDGRRSARSATSSARCPTTCTRWRSRASSPRDSPSSRSTAPAPTPREWLAAGGDPDPVVELAASLGQHR